MKINQCHIENFTVFDDLDIHFCAGINTIIGANGTGKSHLLKILYAMSQYPITTTNTESVGIATHYATSLLRGMFKPEDGDTSHLLRNKTSGAVADLTIQTENQTRSCRLYANQTYEYGSEPTSVISTPDNKNIFIPPNEVLAVYPGFTASYEKRELAFDQTYYDICKALSAAPLKRQNAILSKLAARLEDLLQGRVVSKGNRFYVESGIINESQTLEASLIAEGHRKLATLVHLIHNGSITEESILFWDEPEANLNPRLIKHIAMVLRELAVAGVQVFIATHDYLLTSELSLAAEYGTEPVVPMRFFTMSRNDNEPVTIDSGETLTDLQENIILDEFIDHYQREQDVIAQSMEE